MKTRSLLRLRTLAAALALCVAISGLAYAAGGLFTWTVTVAVPPGISPDDVHLTFLGTGGSIAKEALVQPAGAIAVSGGNTLNITLNAKADPGDDVVASFVTMNGPISFGGGFWTNGGDTLGPVSTDPDSLPRLKWANRPAAPGASTTVLIALGLLMVGAGAFAIRRRQAELA